MRPSEDNNHQQKQQRAGSKRARDNGERTDGWASTSAPVAVKRGCDEAMSWWNCLMLDITPAQSRVVNRNGGTHQSGPVGNSSN